MKYYKSNYLKRSGTYHLSDFQPQPTTKYLQQSEGSMIKKFCLFTFFSIIFPDYNLLNRKSFKELLPLKFPENTVLPFSLLKCPNYPHCQSQTMSASLQNPTIQDITIYFLSLNFMFVLQQKETLLVSATTNGAQVKRGQFTLGCRENEFAHCRQFKASSNLPVQCHVPCLS